MVLGLSIASPISHLKYMLDVSCLNQFRAPLTFVFAVAAAEIAERERGGGRIILGEWCGEECGLVVYFDNALDTRSSVNLGIF